MSSNLFVDAVHLMSNGEAPEFDRGLAALLARYLDMSDDEVPGLLETMRRCKTEITPRKTEAA